MRALHESKMAFMQSSQFDLLLRVDDMPLNARCLSLLLFVLVSFIAAFQSSPSKAVVDLHKFDTESQRERYLVLVEELRCPKCQNQNLAGSNSQISIDLRRELHRLLIEGKTDTEIKTFMVERYGDFVLYKPPLKASTLLLWLFPLLMLSIGLIALALIIRQRRKKVIASKPLSEEEQGKLDLLVNHSQSEKNK